jgi:hypothetical protein
MDQILRNGMENASSVLMLMKAKGRRYWIANAASKNGMASNASSNAAF